MTFFLVKLNPLGEYQWLKEVPEVLTGDASTGSLNFLEVQSDGDIIITGFTRGVIDWGNGIISNGTNLYQDIIVWEFNSSGDLNWVKTAGGEKFR